MIRHRVFHLIVVATAITACNLVDLHRLAVDTDPSGRGEIVPGGAPIRVTFSRAVQRESAEASFMLERDGSEIDVDFFWRRDGFDAYPVQTPEPGVRHELRIAGSVIDEKGLDHTVDEYVPFFFETDTIRPRIVESRPSSNVETGVFDPLALTFNTAMDPATVEASFSLSPETNVTFTWTEQDSKVTLNPEDQWEPLTVYSWSLSGSAKSKDGVPVARRESGTFFTQKDSELPALEGIRFALREANAIAETATLSTDGVVLLDFTIPVRFDSVRRAAEIRPSVPFGIEENTDTEFLMRFDEPLDPGTQYEISISDELRSLSGNAPRSDTTIVVETESERQEVRRIRSVWGDAGSTGEKALDTQQEIGTAVRIGLADPDGTNTLQFSFAFPYRSASDRNRMIDAIELQAVLPQRLPNPEVEQIRWLENGSVLRISYAGLETSESAETPSIYRLRIASGSASATDDVPGLERPVEVYLKTEVR